MKKKLLLLLWVLCLLSTHVAWAQYGTYTANGMTWYYQLEGSPKTATIGGTTTGSDYSGALNIPGSIKHAGKTCIVTKIGDDSFRFYTYATALSIPTSVTAIGKAAFFSCNLLTGTLSLPNVTTIGDQAFYDCNLLTGTLSLPKVITIGNGAFQRCYGFTGSLSLPKVTTIGDDAFDNCFNLNGTLSLPNVVTIGYSAFKSCKNLNGTLSLPKATTIGEAAFNQCSGFNGSLLLPKTTTIGPNAFSSCSGFTGTLSLPNVTVLGYNAFSSCSGFTGTLSLPKVTTIGESAFANCSNLTSLSLPKVTTINKNAFQGCTELTGTLTLPKTLTTIESLAFLSCSNLKAVTFENGTNLTTITGYQHFLLCNNLQYIDMRGVTLPAGFITSRNNYPFFQGIQPYTMVYLPATAPPAEAGEENFVVGNHCDKFVIYEQHYSYQSGNVGCDYPIQQDFTATTAEYHNRSFSGSNCKTLCLPYPATLPIGIRAYEAKIKKSNGEIRFISLGDGDGTLKLAANTPYLLLIIDGGTHTFGTENNALVKETPAAMEVALPDGNTYFGGTTVNIDNATAAGMKAYNLINSEWRPIRTDNPNGYIHSFRAYMRTTGPAPAKGFALVLDDDDTTTGIDSATEDDVEQGNSPIYTLDGKRMGTDINALPSGEIYIKNGKKFYKF